MIRFTRADAFTHVDSFAQLMLQAIEHEQRAIDVYKAALNCVTNEALREEWEQYLAETRSHVDVLLEVCEVLRIDPSVSTIGREVMRDLGYSIVASIERGAADGNAEMAQLIACELVLLIETKDHLNWTLLGSKARKALGAKHALLRVACEQMEGEEDEHLHHARGWAFDLWNERLGFVSVRNVDFEKPLLARRERRREV